MNLCTHRMENGISSKRNTDAGFSGSKKNTAVRKGPLNLSVKMTLIIFVIYSATLRQSFGQAYQFRRGVDLGISLSGAAVQGGMQYLMFRDRNKPVPAAGREIQLGPDRWFHYHWRSQPARISDMLMAVQFAFPLIATNLNVKDRNWMNCAMVCSESLLWTVNLTQGVKLLKLRSRPFVYGPNTPNHMISGIDARYSFLSGHSSTSFCLATAFSLAMKQMNIPAQRRTILSATAFIGAGSIAALRVVAGKHYPTDVLAGMVLGCGVALLNHHVHVRH